MGVIEIRFQMDAWDCFLYSGVLYVLNTSNELVAYDWPKLVQRVQTPESHMALQCAFARADYFKTDEWKPVLESPELYERLRRSVRRAEASRYQIDSATLNECLLYRIDNPLGSITSALTIYNNSIYLSSSIGTFSLALSRKHIAPKKSAMDQIWEGRAVSLSGGGISSLAVGAGSDGAHRYRTEGRFSNYSDSLQLHQISSRHTTAVDWSDINIFRSSLKDPGELIAFTRAKRQKGLEKAPDRWLMSVEIEPDRFDYTWAFQGQVFGLRDGKLSTFRWSEGELKRDFFAASQREVSAERYLHHVRTVPLRNWKGRVISAGTSTFGTIVECESDVRIVYPDGSVWTLPYDVSRWRTYNRATYYWNQLHIVNEQDFVALGFTDKFFTDAGLSPPTAVHRVEPD